MITVKYTESNRSFKTKVDTAISEYLNRLIFRKKGAIIRDIRKLIPRWILSQPEIQSLRSNAIGSLSAELGLVYGTEEEAINAIVIAATNSVALDISKISKRNLQGGIKAQFMPTTFADLLDLPEGHVITDEGTDLHWLKWLLFEGFGAIIVGYSFTFQKGGRSQGGYMRKGGLWRVPPEFAGTQTDNFITRAFTGPKNEEQIARIFQRHIK